MIVTLCLNPVIQKTLLFNELKISEVNRTSVSQWDASGKGVNVSRVLSQLDSKCLYISQSGGSFSNWFKELLDKDKINSHLVLDNANIRFCYTIVDKNETTELVEEGNPVDEVTDKKIREEILSLINDSKKGKNQVSCFVITGTKSPGFSSNLYPDLAKLILQNGFPLVIDYRGEDLVQTLEKTKEILKNQSCKEFPKLIIKPNKKELRDTFAKNQDTFDIASCITDLYRKYCCASVITDSTNKIVTYDGKSLISYDSIKLPKEMIKNTTGCGDAFTAGVASIISKNGLDYETFSKAVNKGIECGMLNAKTLKPGSIEL